MLANRHGRSTGRMWCYLIRRGYGKKFPVYGSAPFSSRIPRWDFSNTEGISLDWSRYTWLLHPWNSSIYSQGHQGHHITSTVQKAFLFEAETLPALGLSFKESRKGDKTSIISCRLAIGGQWWGKRWLENHYGQYPELQDRRAETMEYLHAAYPFLISLSSLRTVKGLIMYYTYVC